mgnify:CR=1 FL=1
MPRPAHRGLSRRRARRWHGVAALGLLAAALGLGAAPDARAQEVGDPTSAFGGFTASGRANGFQLTYDVENVFPLPSPLFQASLPEASTTFQSGPTATALGSLAYPGNVLANLPAIVAQGAPEAGGYVPPYPVLSRADHPAGPPEARQEVGAANSSVRASAAGAEAITTMGGGDLPPFLRIGAVTTSARTGVVEGKIESRSRVELSGVDLLFGLVRAESITESVPPFSSTSVKAATWKPHRRRSGCCGRSSRISGACSGRRSGGSASSVGRSSSGSCTWRAPASS